MYQIVGKENLEAVNVIADRSLDIMMDISKLEESKVLNIDSDYLASLASGYLFLYNAVLDAGIMPSQKSAKHQIFKVH